MSNATPALIEDNENWQKEIKSRYLTQEGYKRASPWIIYRKRGSWWRLCAKIANLPWIAIFTVLFASILIAFVVTSIINNPTKHQNVQRTIELNGTSLVVQIIVVECQTDVSVEECETRVRERAESSDFQRAMTETHLFCTIIVCWAGALIFFVTQAMRTRKRNRYLELLPHRSIAVWNSAASEKKVEPEDQASGSGGGGSDVLDLVQDLPVHYEMERTIILSKFLHTYDPHCAQSADPNWGSTNGKRKGTHFRTTLSSLHALEDLATGYDVGLSWRRDQTARQYIDMLKTRFAANSTASTELGVSHEALDVVLALYEQARFGQGPVTEDMFNEYGNAMFVLSMNFAALAARKSSSPAAALPSPSAAFWYAASPSTISVTQPVVNIPIPPPLLLDAPAASSVVEATAAKTSGDGLLPPPLAVESEGDTDVDDAASVASDGIKLPKRQRVQQQQQQRRVERAGSF